MNTHAEIWGTPDDHEPRTSTVVRVPDDLARELKQWAKIKGKSQGALMRDAFNEWVRTHKAEILADLDDLRAKVEAA